LPAQVFLSYARLDNEPPPGRERLSGFVTALQEHLKHQLNQLGPPRPALWRDVGNIERTDQFERVLREQVANSDYLIVVFSPNWLASEWCRRELETFRQHWAAEGEARVRERILLVNKTDVPRDTRPLLLQGQEGHNFFALDHDRHESGRERPFFDVGKVLDDRFVQEVRELARKLRRLAGGDPAAASAIARSAPAGRTIYLARPADDMRQAFDRIAAELIGRGFAVVPEGEIPNDESADDFIRRALAGAELSVHPLGEKRGFAPPEHDPIVRLQLALAAERAAQPADADAPGFRRILWAPKILGGVESERDPAQVLARFGAQLDGDKLVGEPLTRFIEFLVRHLDQTAPRRAAAAPAIEAGAKIYIDHQELDIDYADELAHALQQRSITPVLPVLQGDKAEIQAQNRKAKRDCDAVALCWGDAPETWAIATAHGLQDWRRLGRQEKLSSALVVAPPPHRLKERRLKFVPPGVDRVLDLSNRDKPAPEDLDPWLGPSGAARPADE